MKLFATIRLATGLLSFVTSTETATRGLHLRGVSSASLSAQLHRRTQLPTELRKCIKKCIRTTGKKKGKCKKRCTKKKKETPKDSPTKVEDSPTKVEDVFIPDINRDPPKGNGKWVELENGVTFKIATPKELGTTDDCTPENESLYGRYPCVVPVEERDPSGLHVGGICTDSNACSTGCCMPTRVGAQVTPETPFENSQLCLYQETVPHVPCVYFVDTEDEVVDARGKGNGPKNSICKTSDDCQSDCCVLNSDVNATGFCVHGVPEVRSDLCAKRAGDPIPRLTETYRLCQTSTECKSKCCVALSSSRKVCLEPKTDDSRKKCIPSR